MKDMFQKTPGTSPTLLHSRDFVLAASARFAAAVGYGAVVVSILLELQTTIAGPSGVWAVTGFLLLSTIPMVLVAPWAGRLADTRDSRVLAVTTSLVSAGAAVAMALSLAWLPNFMPALFVLIVVLETAQAVAAPTWSALLPRIVGEDRTPRALGTMQATLMLAQLAGPAVGGILVGAGGLALSFWLAGGCYGLLAVGAVIIRTRRAPVRGHDDATPRLLDGLRVLNKDILVKAALVGVLFVVLAAEAINILQIFLARETLGASAAEYGFLAAAMGAGLVSGALVAGRITTESMRVTVFVISIAGTAAGLILMGTAPGMGLLYAYSVLVGGWIGALNATFGALLMLRTREEQRGQVSAMANGLTRAVSVASLGLGGILGSLFTPRAGFLACGVAMMAVAVVLGVVMARVWRRAAVDGAGETPPHAPAKAVSPQGAGSRP